MRKKGPRIPLVPRDSILMAMQRFNEELRDTPQWRDWIVNGRHKYGILYQNILYPVKQTISLATGVSPRRFSGGRESNNYLNKLGFEVVRLDAFRDLQEPLSSLQDPRSIFKERHAQIGAALGELADLRTEKADSSLQWEREQFATMLGTLLASEEMALDHLRQYVAGKGFHYDFEALLRFHISIKTKPFVILSGLSGSGKSKLPQLYAEAFGAEVCPFPVSPAWTSDADLIGYYNPVHERFVSTEFLDFLIRAEEHPEKLHIAILDEMNLARVEYYFARFLSVLELDRDRQVIPFVGDSVPVQNLERRQVQIGQNLIFVGTVNVDETVQPLSDKVLDRANVVTFDTVDIRKRPPRRPVSAVPVPMTLFNLWRQPGESHSEYVMPILADLNHLLLEPRKKYGRNMQFGHRVASDIESWVDQAAQFLSWREALDIQINQRVLSKIRGRSDELKELLDGLSRFFNRHQLRRCGATVGILKRQLESGYVHHR